MHYRGISFPCNAYTLTEVYSVIVTSELMFFWVDVCVVVLMLTFCCFRLYNAIEILVYSNDYVEHDQDDAISYVPFLFLCVVISNLSCCIKANAVTIDMVFVLLVAYLIIRMIGIVVYTTSELGTSSILVNVWDFLS